MKIAKEDIHVDTPFEIKGYENIEDLPY